MPKEKALPIATADLETDPFLYGRAPLPFAAGYYDGEKYIDFYGDNAISDFIQFLENEPPHTIYFHNGGGFDFYFLQPWLSNPVFFIRSRIAKVGLLGKHELRDSYRMIPVPLADYQKDAMDYSIMELENRHKPENKKLIRDYLHGDCTYLYSMVQDFIARYGMHLTIGSAAIRALRHYHPNGHSSPEFDARFRPYYMGGRNECFAAGEIKAPMKVYDVNSMYPHVMATYWHPLEFSFYKSTRLPDSAFYFAHIRAKSKGALPLPGKHGLTFPHGTFDFMACSHEINQALQLGLLEIIKVFEVLVFNDTQRFDKYVNEFIQRKIEADEKGDKGGRLFAKLFLNSSYGKFGQNPDNYKDCSFFDSLDACDNAGYKPSAVNVNRIVGEKPAPIERWSYNNVAIAASITSAARAELMRGLAHAENPVYCDTDSIIATNLDMPLHHTNLGMWDIEAEMDTIYIAGKKLYACYTNSMPVVNAKGKEKKACKGANLSAMTIRDIALGGTVNAYIDAPSLKIGHAPEFIKRTIQKTVDIPVPNG